MFPANDPPPPYPGLSSFSLISYDDAVAVDNSGDSLRLPSYQPRTSRRFHPYLHILPTLEDPLRRYHNTIFDESFTPLTIPDDSHGPVCFSVIPWLVVIDRIQAPSAPVVTILTIPPPPTIPAPLPPPSPPPLQPVADLSPEEQRRRHLRILHSIPDIQSTIQAGLKAAEKLESESRAIEGCTNYTPPHDDDNAPAAT
ncbi:hypothetical protein H0H92_005526 [Tricholoma furcatifolium]|nr:hypothetical protein H0H92_005526 [Tricholoma furcatifolium]